MFRVSRRFFSAGKIPKIASPRNAEKPRTIGEHRAATCCELCAPCRHSVLCRIDQGHPQGQAMAGRRKHRAPRERCSSIRQSRLTDIAEIYTKSPAIFVSWRAFSLQKFIFMSWRALSRQKLFKLRSRGTVASLGIGAPIAARSSGRPARAPLILTIRSDERCNLMKHDTRRW